MRKIIFILLFLLVTGCGNKGNEVLCTSKEIMDGGSMNQEIKVKFKNDEFSSAEFVMNVKIISWNDGAENFRDIISYYVTLLKSEFSGYKDSYGVDVDVKKTSDRAEVSFKMDKSSFGKLYSDHVSKKDDVISYLKEDGYTCK